MKTIVKYLFLIVLFACSTLVVAAQEPELEQSLAELGLVEPQVTLEQDLAFISYKQTVSEMGDFEDELARMANIFVLFDDALSPEAEITVRQLFDDGQIMQIVGTPALGKAFLDGEIDAAGFELALRFEPQTRGPMIVEGVCDLEAGDTCQDKDACACYPNEECRPDDSAANDKGCVVVDEPANAHLEGTEYACDEGYVWNLDMTACQPAVVCPEGMVEDMNGECVPAAAAIEEPAGTEGAPLTGLKIPVWIWFIIGGGCLLLVGLLILGFLVIKSWRKPKKPARPDVRPAPAPALPAPFAALERRFNDLQAMYRAGSINLATYQTEMRDLVIKDQDGRYWSRTTAGWMWYDGQRWIQGRPPQQ